MENTGKSSLSRLWTASGNLVKFVLPFLSYNLLGRVSPVLAGYKITHNCNLKCSHCPYWKRSGQEQDFDGVVETMRQLKQMGVKILILEGGEPLLWKDAKKNIRHVVEAARKYFPCVCMTTNGTLGWQGLELDRVWVSLDGPARIHDEIRGRGMFFRVFRNLQRPGQTGAFVSTTVNAFNAESIPQLVTMLLGVADGVTIQFHYPYNGFPDPLFLPVPERGNLLDQLIFLKGLGYPVANSYRSLRELKQEKWTCQDKLLANAEPDGTVLHGCYLKNRGPQECGCCGFAAHNEMTLAFNGNLESILAGMKIFFGKQYVDPPSKRSV
ncbi:MAG: radical SAM protein [Desulfomonile tiedjei]|uniref:Radical SAM protein n=1 Tax=Desulfomonile tiedjei TaxID=2358 RepID=A0A9D6V623_9BACT|nr:radical SAM protein [Desulfomonile tiedjei]